MATVMRQFLDNSYLYGANASFIEDLYEKYLVNPQSVAEEWREYFDRTQVLPGNAAKDVAHAPVVESFVQRAKAGQLGGPARTLPVEPVTPERPQVAALLLVTAYRIAGSRWATVDPLKRMPRPNIPELEPGFYDLSEADLDQTVNAGSFVGLDRTSLRNLLQALRDTYCRNIGFEYMFISERAQRQWIQERIEPVRATPDFPPEQKKRLLQKLTEAEQLERYLHTRYVGQKRFSLEGGESLIPSIDELIQRAGGNGVQEMVIGMAHRGRLNVLVNVLGKMPKDLFLEFEGKQASELPSGDVKYHNGFSSDISTSGGPVHISLAFNPSHLEIVDPVVEGSVRARQRRRDDKTGDQVMPVLLHGDAAFAAQGVQHAAADVQEDHAASGHAQALRRQAARAGRDRARGARGADQAVPRHAGRRPADGQPGALQLQEQVRGRLGAVPQLEVDRRRRHAGAAGGTAKVGGKTYGRT